MTETLRRSGRARKSLQESLNENELQVKSIAVPRKSARAANNRDANDEDEVMYASEDEQQSERDSDADETEQRAKKSRARKLAAKANPAKARKPRAPPKKKRAATDDDDNEANEDENGDQPQPQPRVRKSSRSKQSKVTVTSSDTVAAEEESFSSLWHSVARSTSTVKSIARSFIDTFRDDETRAKFDLVNFLLEASGSKGGMSDGEVDSMENDGDIAEIVGRYIDSDSNYLLPLAAPIKRVKKFNSRLKEFFSQFFSLVQSDAIYENFFLKEVFPTIVRVLAKSPIRSVRLTATTVYSGWTNGLVSQCVSLTAQLDTANKQQARIKSKRSNTADSLSQSIAAITEQVNEEFKEVFQHRYRDVDSGIRSLCIDSLGSWISMWPQHYLDDSHLKYLGWALSDRGDDKKRGNDATVRKSAVDALTNIYQHASEDTLTKLTNFNGRFLTRINEMCSDIDVSVCVSAIELMTLLLKLNLLTESLGNDIPRMLWDENPAVRKSAAKFVMEDTFTVDDEEKSEKSAEDLMQCLSIFEQYCPIMQQHRQQSQPKADKGKKVNGKEIQSTSGNNNHRHLLVTSSRLSMLEPSNYESSVRTLVEDFFPSLPCLSDWPAIHSLVHQLDETKAQALQQKNSKKKKSTKDSASTELLDPELSDRHLTCLLLILVSSARIVHSAYASKLSKSDNDESKLNDSDVSTHYNALSLFLVDHLSSLLTMVSQSSTVSNIVSVVSLTLIVRLDDYATHRKHSEFSALLASLKSITNSHSNDAVLRACASAWRRLVKENESFTDEASAAIDDLIGQWKSVIITEVEGESQSSQSLTASQSAHEIVSDEDRTVTVALVMKRIVALYRALHIIDLAFTSLVLHTSYTALLPVFVSNHSTMAAQELLLSLLQLLYTELGVRISEINRESPQHSEIDRITAQRNQLVSALETLLEHSQSFTVKDAAFALLSDCFVLFNGKLQGGVLSELSLPRDRVMTLDQAFCDYFQSLMDGDQLTERIREAKLRAKSALSGAMSDSEESEDVSEEEQESLASDLRLQAMIAASHVVCFDHNRNPIEAPRSSAQLGPLRHSLLTAMFLAQLGGEEADLEPIIRASLNTLKSLGWSVLLIAQLTSLRVLWERHVEVDALRALASKFALSAGINHPPFAPLLRLAIVIAVRDPPTHLSFFDVVLPYLQRSSRADADSIVPAFLKAHNAAIELRSPDWEGDSESKQWESLERFGDAVAKKLGKSSIEDVRYIERVAAAPATPSTVSMTTPTTDRTGRMHARLIDEIDARMSLTPISALSPRTADTARSSGSIQSFQFNLSPVRENPINEQPIVPVRSNKRKQPQFQPHEDDEDEKRDVNQWEGNEDEEEEAELSANDAKSKRTKVVAGKRAGRTQSRK